MRAALLEEFNAPELQYRKRQELHGFRQNNEEKLSQNLNFADQTRLDIMIAGLDPQYRKFIQQKQPATYSDAAHTLLLKEAVSPPPER